jgi:hypothetical protein
MASRKRKQSEKPEKQALLPPNTKYDIFANEYGIESIINFMDYPELVELGKISDYYKQIIYFKHPGSRTHAITNITEYLNIFKNPQYIRIANSMNLRNLKLFLSGENKIKSLDLTEKEINANIFSDLNLDAIEELVIGKFPKDQNNQILSYFKKLKKLTYGENTYISPRESKIVPRLFQNFVIDDKKNYFRHCQNNEFDGLFEVVNKGRIPYKYIGYIRNSFPAISGMFYHTNRSSFHIKYNIDSNSEFSTIDGIFSSSSNITLYKCKAIVQNNAPYPCLNSLQWKVIFLDNSSYTGKLFYGIIHDLTYESDISLTIGENAKIFSPDGTKSFEGSFENGFKKKGKEYNKNGKISYDGTFVNNYREGTGTLYYSDGFVYKGEFKKNKFSGCGEVHDKDNNLIQKGLFSDNLIIQGDKYFNEEIKVSGRFEKGKIVFGTLLKDDVLQFEGFFDKSEKPENGAIYFSGIKRYSGNILNNKENGYGKSYNRDGSLFYDGEFANGKYHGKGTMYKNNLIKFEGTFENNLRVGFFTITYKSGHIIKGIYKNDSLHGKITIVLLSGKTFEGMLTTAVNSEKFIITFTKEQTGKTYTSTSPKDEQIAINNLFELLEQDV